MGISLSLKLPWGSPSDPLRPLLADTELQGSPAPVPFLFPLCSVPSKVSHLGLETPKLSGGNEASGLDVALTEPRVLPTQSLC